MFEKVLLSKSSLTGHVQNACRGRKKDDATEVSVTLKGFAETVLMPWKLNKTWRDKSKSGND